MIEHRAWQRNVRRSLLVAFASTLACCLPLRANAQEKPTAEPAQAAEQAQQSEQSLKQKLEAAEQLRKNLEAELGRLKAQVEALKAQGKESAATKTPAAQAGTAPGKLGALQRLAPGARRVPASPTHIKIFRLQHRNANDMREIVLLFTPAQSGSEVPLGGAPGSGQAAGLTQAGGIGVTGPVATNENQLRIVADPRSNSLIVRASDDALANVEKLVKTFDVPAGTIPVLEDQNNGVFTVRNADPEHITQLLQDLGVDAKLAPNTNTLSVQGSEATLKEVGELIEALDVKTENEK
jgi:type II secretory pathway component GspD/PulD (secretin)